MPNRLRGGAVGAPLSYVDTKYNGPSASVGSNVQISEPGLVRPVLNPTGGKRSYRRSHKRRSYRRSHKRRSYSHKQRGSGAMGAPFSYVNSKYSEASCHVFSGRNLAVGRRGFSTAINFDGRPFEAKKWVDYWLDPAGRSDRLRLCGHRHVLNGGALHRTLDRCNCGRAKGRGCPGSSDWKVSRYACAHDRYGTHLNSR